MDLSGEYISGLIHHRRSFFDFNDCIELGFADYDTKQLFESLYTQYHALGGNGTMTGYYARILELPDGKGGENT